MYYQEAVTEQIMRQGATVVLGAPIVKALPAPCAIWLDGGLTVKHQRTLHLQTPAESRMMQPKVAPTILHSSHAGGV